MRIEQIEDKLTQIFSEVFKYELALHRATTANDVENWDSLNHIVLIKKIEDEFEIEFDLFDVIEMKNVGDIMDYIREKLDANN